MEEYDVDVAVIGSGPGGEGAAMQAAKRGQRVVVIERFQHVGGGCTHWGTIPSKALRYGVSQILRAQQNPLLRPYLRTAEFTFIEMLHSAGAIIAQQEELRRGFYDRNGVPVITGSAAFLDANTLAVTREDGAAERVSARHIVIAVGSSPWHPPAVDFTHPRIFDSDSILGLDWRPFSITIYGAGVIGCEYASIFKNLGMKVNLINTRARLLEFLDDEITDALSYHLRDQGVIIRHNERMSAVTGEDDGVVLDLDSGKRIKTDILLWANGRSGNVAELGLDNAGLEANSRGQIPVDAYYRTMQPHIYAVGDVVGFPALASAAYDQGRFASLHICGDDLQKRVEDIPTGIYTSPEISSIGKTERELTEEKMPYEVGTALFRTLARAQITGVRVGMLKLLFHREDYRILGIHCFGVNASEIVHIGQAIMSQPGDGNDIRYFANTTFNYPTMAEAYRVAALNGLNRVF